MGERIETMVPAPVIEWAVWARLDSYRSVELILLKGHLLLEVALDHALTKRDLISSREMRLMSFSRKVLMLESASSLNRVRLDQALILSKELNSMRNKLAHEPFFEGSGQEIGAWAERVLSAYPSSKFQKFTPRTKFSQAIAALAVAVFDG